MSQTEREWKSFLTENIDAFKKSLDQTNRQFLELKNLIQKPDRIEIELSPQKILIEDNSAQFEVNSIIDLSSFDRDE